MNIVVGEVSIRGFWQLPYSLSNCFYDLTTFGVGNMGG